MEPSKAVPQNKIDCRSGACQAAEKVASFLNSRIAETGINFHVLFFSRRYLFFDAAQNVYTIHYDQKVKGYFVLVEPAKDVKKNGSVFPEQKFLVQQQNIFVYANFKLISQYLFHFLKKRGYPVDKIDWAEKIAVFRFRFGQGTITAGPFSAHFQINLIRGLFSARLKDRHEEEPYFCGLHHQYVLTFHNRLSIKENKTNIDNLLLSYSENEIKTLGVNPVALFKRFIYGFSSPNMRALYSDDGLIPEMRRVIHLTVLLNLAISIITASVFVRVAERLKGNTWYTLAAGALIFLRVPAEIFNMRRSLKITRGLPGSRMQEMEDSEEFRAVYETRPLRSWRNFERGYTELFRATEYLSEKIEKYRLAKPKLYNLVRENKKEEITSFLTDDLGLNMKAARSLLTLAKQLSPLDQEEIKTVLNERAHRLKKEGLILESEWTRLLEFTNKTFGELLERDTVAGAYKSLKDALRRAERPPEPAELFSLVDTCYRGIIPFRRAEIMLYLSLFLIGYGATYSPDIPIIAFALYYLFNGVMIQLITSGFDRISFPVWMQYVFREMENDPAIASASDTWNEFNSQQMRLMTLFSSVGLILGVSGRLLAGVTHGISWFSVDALAVIIYLFGLREWFRFYQGLIRRCRP